MKFVDGHVDFLFGCPDALDLLYTSSPVSPLSSGFLVAKRNNALFESLRWEVTHAEKFTLDGGWFDKGYPCRAMLGIYADHTMAKPSAGCPGRSLNVSYSYEGPSGLLWSFFTFKHPYGHSKFKAAPLDACVFNFLWGYQCTIKSFGNTKIVHKVCVMFFASRPSPSL